MCAAGPGPGEGRLAHASGAYLAWGGRAASRATQPPAKLPSLAPAPAQLLNLEVRPPAGAAQPGGAAGSPPAAPGGPKMTKAAKEAALQKLVADGWLKHGAFAGHYCLGVGLRLGARWQRGDERCGANSCRPCGQTGPAPTPLPVPPLYPPHHTAPPPAAGAHLPGAGRAAAGAARPSRGHARGVAGPHVTRPVLQHSHPPQLRARGARGCRALTPPGPNATVPALHLRPV
jgi:hypothetical protein